MNEIYPRSIINAIRMIGTPYLLGSKWAPGTPCEALRTPVDCSGLSRWALAFDGIELPDGSFNQIAVCTRLPDDQQQNPPARSLGFFKAPSASAVDHVVISTGTGVVIEARGAPYNSIILRPVAAWNAQPGFLGFYAPPQPKGE